MTPYGCQEVILRQTHMQCQFYRIKQSHLSERKRKTQPFALSPSSRQHPPQEHAQNCHDKSVQRKMNNICNNIFPLLHMSNLEKNENEKRSWQTSRKM